ncbi:MAG: hypothetical protein Kow00133_04550 [Amphiplicatus sp.]
MLRAYFSVSRGAPFQPKENAVSHDAIPRLAAAGVLAALSAACGGLQSPTPAAQDAPAGERGAADAPLAFATTYRCGAEMVRLGVRGDAMRLQAGGEEFELRRAVSASGVKYEAVGDPDIYFWTKGDYAIFSLRGDAHPECAKIEDAPAAKPYRARGNEPGWALDIGPDTITLLTNFGENRITAPIGAPEQRDGLMRYRAEGEDLTITVRDTLCKDDMTGMPHPDAVSVAWKGQMFTGCGGEPVMLLVGEEWVVEDIDRRGVIDMSRVSIRFSEDGRVSGLASCNRYAGRYFLAGEGLRIENAAATDKSCAPALMNQERAFLDILADVRVFDIDAAGALILHAPDGRILLARR